MAKVTYDAQSFSLDRRRLWLVSAAMHYPRIPRGLWRDRIRAAKQAGFNCIETYAFWNAHEPEPGVFDFTDNLDVRRFVEIVAEEGMFCWFRPGPYVCAEWDNGGLPPWLHRVKPDRRSGAMRLREGSGPFLSAVSRYYSAVMEQVADLQVTRPVAQGRPAASPTRNTPGAVAGGFAGQGAGPIVLLQVENEWFCRNDEQEEAYHQQLIRLLREAGAEVPLTVCNQLWQPVDGTIHTWNASANLPADLRQLAAVQPDAPRLVSEYWTGWFDHWGGEHADTVDAGKHFYRMAAVLAAGSQPNLFMFHGGTNFGFTGGRTVGGPSMYMTTSYDYDAPLLEAGGRAGKYDLTKRIATFASQFGGVFAHLEPAAHAVAVAPDEGDHPPSVIHQRGGRGGVTFILRSPNDKQKQATLLLPNGLSLPVPLGGLRAVWLLTDTPLSGGVTLDYTNLSPLAWVDDRLLVLYGPAGAGGLVSLDGAQVEVTVPTGKTPKVEHVNGVTLLVLNPAMADAGYAHPEGWVVGARALDQHDEPLPRRGWPTRTLVMPGGEVTKTKQSAMRRPTAPSLDAWQAAGCDAHLDGSARDYTVTKGPAAFDDLGRDYDYGYGWARLRLPESSAAKAVKAISPGSGDRLHVYRGGKFERLVGLSVGGNGLAPAPLRGAGEWVVLIDNLGRFNYGPRVGERKGLLDHFYAVEPVRLPKPKRRPQNGPDPFALAGYVPQQRRGDVRPAEAWVWHVKPAGRRPVVLELNAPLRDAVVKVNGEPVAVWHHEGSAGFQRFVLDPADDGPFNGGQNELELAFFTPAERDAAKPADAGVRLWQTTANLTAKAEWAYAPWSPPAEDAYAPGTMPKNAKAFDRPTWYRATFRVAGTRCPLFFDADGLSKGQLYLNARNVGRYFVQTRDGQDVPPQRRYYLPEPWLNLDGDNVLTLFDEHGFSPHRSSLVYDELGPYG
ncbi:MAG: beta-galactosidase [Planctomycetota bacterium]